jgi:hypothetical protein
LAMSLILTALLPPTSRLQALSRIFPRVSKLLLDIVSSNLEIERSKA